MREFASWLSGTGLSEMIASYLWMIPTIQSIHLLAIGVLVGAVFMVDMRILGVVSRDQTLAQTNRRFGPWFWGAFIVLILSGGLLIVGEPARELLSFSFWAKMVLIVIGVLTAIAFQAHLRSNPVRWESDLVMSPGVKAMALVSIVIWIGIMVMGRLIAWDAQIWGSLSPQA